MSSKLIPSVELEYLELLYLKTKLVNTLSKKLLNNHGELSIPKDKINTICISVFNAATSLVLFSQEFAKKNPGSDTDKFRSKARAIRLIIKQLIYHTKEPDLKISKQINDLMKLSINLSSHISIIFSSYIKRRNILTNENYNLNKTNINTNNLYKTPKTYDEMIKIFLNQMKNFTNTFQVLSNDINDFLINKSNINNQNATILLCKNLFQELEDYNKNHRNQIELLSRCDSLHQYTSEIIKSIRLYISNVNASDEEKQSTLQLTNKLRLTIGHIICILRSFVIQDNNPLLLQIPHHSLINSIKSLPIGLQNQTLFHVGGIDTQLNILQSQTNELKGKLKTLHQQLDLVNTFTKVKQKRLHQLKEHEERILEFEVARNRREKEWFEREEKFVKKTQKNIDTLKEIIDNQKESLGQPIININLNSYKPPSKSDIIVQQQSQSNLSKSSPITNSPSSSTKRKFRQSIAFLKKESSTNLRKQSISNPSPFPLLETKKEVSLASPNPFSRFPSSPNFFPITDSTSDDEFSSDISNDTNKNISDNEFQNSIDIECNKHIQRLRLNIGLDKLKKLEEQLIFRKRHHFNIAKLSSEQSSIVTSQLTSWIKQQQLTTLEELRDLHKSESTLLLQSEKLNNEIEIHQNFLISHKNKINSSNCSGEILKYDNIKVTLESATKAYQCQYKLLLEKIWYIRPHKESINQNTTNIWKELLITNGPNKTVIYSENSDNNDSSRLQVRAGTLNQLVMRLTDEKRHDLNFLKTFITTLQSFTTPELLFQKLVERYNVPRDKQSDVPDEQWKQNIVLPIQIRVYNVIRLWLDMRFPDFEYKLMKKVNEFIDTHLRNDGHSKFATALDVIIKRKLLQSNNSLKRNSFVKKSSATKIYDFLINTPSIDTAKHITHIDSKYYCAIQSTELIDHLGSKQRCHNLTKAIEHFNNVSSWITYLIVKHTELSKRINTLSKFMDIAKHLRDLNNFNGLLSFIGGIRNSAVHRLKQTRTGVNPNIVETFEQLCTLMKGTNAYKSYREALHSVCPPVVPYVGVYLTDLTFINDGNPNSIDGLINFRKRELIYRVIEEFQQYQQVSYTFDINDSILAFLNNIQRYPEDEVFTLSKKNEPNK